MMTLEEIQNAEAVNLDVAREAYAQVSARLADQLDTRKTFDQRAGVMFAGYVAMAIALLVGAGQLHLESGWPPVIAAMISAGALLLVGAGLFALSMNRAEYGNLGSLPGAWLEPQYLVVGDLGLAKLLCYQVAYMDDAIANGSASNRRKGALLSAGIGIGFAAPFIAFAAFIALGGL